MDKQFNFVYVTKNLVNGKKYIGKHSTSNIFDGYYGSGKLIEDAVSKYGISNFETSIIKMFDTEDEAYDYEEFLVDADIISDDSYYNIDLGGRGSMRGRTHKSSSKLKISLALKGRSKPERTEEHKAKLLEAASKRRKPPKPKKVRVQKYGVDNALYGRTRPDSVVEKCKAINRTHEIWSIYQELFSFWKINGYPGWRKMHRLAVENGYPDTAYDKIIKQFKQDIM